MAGMRYRIELPNPHHHVATITATFAPPAGAATVDIAMPAWCPGSYLIRDYARFVRDLRVVAEDGAPRTATKIDKSTWRIEVGGARELSVVYGVYGHDLTVRTNHIDATHAFLHGPATFVYCETLRTEPVELDLHIPGRQWVLSTGLRRRDGATRGAPSELYVLAAASIDELFDMPIHVGQVQTFRFLAAEVPIELSVWGEACPGVFSWDQLTTDLGKVMADHVARFAAAPFDHYTFVLMLSHDAYGGLEHRNSSINLFSHLALTSRKQYEQLLELLSHELFHAWNGKRIAPPVLLDFDYRQEAYTRCLWVVEGITSYYDRWALRSARVITGKSYLEKVLDDWTRLLAIPGRNRQSVEASSFDAWIKLYKPDESNLNTTVSYYLKGGLVMFALDLYIRRHSDGARSLDQVLQALWRDFGARGVGYPENLEKIFTAAAGVDLHEAFASWIRGTSDPDLAQELGHVGIELRRSYDSGQTADGATPGWLGITTSGCKITGVLDETPAQAAGLSPGDEIIAIDGFQVSSEAALRAVLAGRKPGDAIDVALFRRQKLTHLAPTLEVAPRNKWELVAIADPGLAARRYEAWLGEPHPSGQTITTVNAASRAL